MDLGYGKEYEAFRKEVRSLLEKNGPKAPRGGAIDQRPGEDVVAWQQLLIENGFAARTVPKKYGGYGAEPDILKKIIIDEEFARAGVRGALAGQGIDMLVPTLLEHGSEEQRERWIGPTIRGDVFWCQGYSEPGSGSDLASLQTRAVDDGDDFVINGHKTWTSSAQYSDMMFCLIRTEPDAPKHQGISYVLIPMDSAGIDQRPFRQMTGDDDFNEVFLTDVRVPKSNVVGKRGHGWKIANSTLKYERNSLASSSILEGNLMSVIREMTTEQVDGQRPMDDPALRDRLLQLQSRQLAAKYHSMRLLTISLAGEPGGLPQLITKLFTCELSHQLNALGIDALGEVGTLYHGSDRIRRNGRWIISYMYSLGLIIGGGTAQIQKNIVSERGLGLPREPKVPQVSA